MAITQTTRVGVTRWSGGNDAFTRDQMDESHERIEARLGTFYSGPIGSRPAAGPAYTRGFYLATNQNAPVGILYYCDGSTWQALNAFSTPSAQTPGDTIVEGTATTSSRSDHKHSLPQWGVTGELTQIALAADAGNVVKFARIDHTHALANNVVIAGKIAAGGVSASNQIANGIIQTGHIAAGAITGALIAEDQRVPPGTVVLWVGLTAPTGWLMCDGASYATASYPALSSVINYKYNGAGATFNVPDFRDRVVRGATTPNSPGTLGVAGGSDTATLVLNNIPSHQHGVGSYAVSAVGTHTHGINIWSGYTNTNHYHGVANIGIDTVGNHNHGIGHGSLLKRYNINGGEGDVVNPTGQRADNITHTDDGGHSHGVYGRTDSLTETYAPWAEHRHPVNGTSDPGGAHTPGFTGSSGLTGSGTAFSVTPKSLTINAIIKI